MVCCRRATPNGKNRPLADIRACSCGCPLPGQIADFLSAGGSRVILAQVFENVADDAVVVDERDHAHLIRAAGAGQMAGVSCRTQNRMGFRCVWWRFDERKFDDGEKGIQDRPVGGSRDRGAVAHDTLRAGANPARRCPYPLQPWSDVAGRNNRSRDLYRA